MVDQLPIYYLQCLPILTDQHRPVECDHYFILNFLKSVHRQATLPEHLTVLLEYIRFYSLKIQLNIASLLSFLILLFIILVMVYTYVLCIHYRHS